MTAPRARKPHRVMDPAVLNDDRRFPAVIDGFEALRRIVQTELRFSRECGTRPILARYYAGRARAYYEAFTIPTNRMES